MSGNITRMVTPNGEIITILPITIKIDRSTGNYFAFDENSGREYSIAELMRMANDGNPSAQCAMGNYYNTESPHADFHEAFKWYKKAAVQNHAEALWNMGNFYALGMGGVKKDFEKTCALLEESANYGFLEAMFHLGQVFMSNDIYDKAIYWLEKADKLGHSEASKHLEAAKLLSGLMDNPALKESFGNISKNLWNN